MGFSQEVKEIGVLNFFLIFPLVSKFSNIYVIHIISSKSMKFVKKLIMR